MSDIKEARSDGSAEKESLLSGKRSEPKPSWLARLTGRRSASKTPSKESIEKPVTPLPKIKVALVGMVLFTDTFSQLLIFPFLPFMVHDFFPHLDKHELGYYAGYLGGMFYIGAFCFNIFWGRQADRYGRRPIMLLGMIGTVISTIAFGFSWTFPWALAIRFVWGSANGNIGVAKTYLSEVCDDTNSPQAFSLMGMLVGFGRIFGPAIGGFLAQPAIKYPSLFGTDPHSLMVRFPYLLPCLFAASFGSVLLLGVFIFMEETLKNPEPLPGARMLRKCWTTIAGTDRRRSAQELEIMAGHEAEAARERAERERKRREKPEPAASELLKDPVIFRSALLYGVLSMTALVSNELFPLWMVAKKRHHGFEMGTSDIGIILSCLGPTQIAYQFLIYPPLVQRAGVKYMFFYCTTLFGLTLFLFPYVEFLQQWEYSHTLVWLSLYLVLVFMVNVRNTCFTCVFVFIANSCVSDIRGTVNGIGQSFAAAGRAVGPTIGSIIFAWSMSSGHGWPFNFHFMWYVLGIFSFILAYLGLGLPDSIVKRKDADKLKASGGADAGRPSVSESRIEVQPVAVTVTPGVIYDAEAEQEEESAADQQPDADTATNATPQGLSLIFAKHTTSEAVPDAIRRAKTKAGKKHGKSKADTRDILGLK